jgi:ATP-dependent DNA ligase
LSRSADIKRCAAKHASYFETTKGCSLGPRWIRPELVVEVKYLTWTEQGLLRQVVYQGIREDKPAADVRRP